LRRLLFLLGNWRVLHQIVEEKHPARVSADMARRKRRQRERADIAQAQFDAQRAALRPATAAGGGGGFGGGGGGGGAAGGGAAAALAANEDEIMEEYEADRYEQQH
jgi:hypothetical protein